MHRSIEATLCLHGAIIMFTAFVAGGMIGAAAFGQVTGTVEDWKVAHMEPLINALLLFAIAGCIDKLALTAGGARAIAYCLIAMAWCNTMFGYMRGLTGAQGYQFDDSIANNIMTLAGMLGVPLGIVAFVLLVRAAFLGKQQLP